MSLSQILGMANQASQTAQSPQKPQWLDHYAGNSTLGQPAQQVGYDPYAAYGNMNDMSLLGTLLANRGGGGGGGGGGAASGYYGYQGDLAQADATRYGWDQQYRIAEGNARRDWDLANLGSNTQRYLGELGSGDTRYTSDNTRYGNYDVANIGRQASDYGNLMNYYGRDIESQRGLQGQLGVADRNLAGVGMQTGAQRYGFDRSLDEVLAQVGGQNYLGQLGLTGQLAGHKSQENVARTQSTPQLLEALTRQARFKQLLPLISQIAGGVLNRIPSYGTPATA